MDKYSGLKRVTSNPGPAKVILNNPNAKPSNAVANGSDSIVNNKVGSAPSLHNKINSDQLPPVPSRNKTTESLQGPNKHTTELESKKLLVPKNTNSRPLSVKDPPQITNQYLPPVAPRKVVSVSPTTSGEFIAAARDAKANNNNVQTSVPPPTAPRKVATLMESAPPKVPAVVPPPTAPRNITAIVEARPVSMPPTQGRNAIISMQAATVESGSVKAPVTVPPPTAPRNVSPTADPRPMSPPLMRNTPSSKPETTAAVPPPTTPRNLDPRPMSPPPTRYTPSSKPETSPLPPKVDSKPKLTIPPLTSPRTSNDSDKYPPVSPREVKPPSPVTPRVTSQIIKPEDLPSVPPRNPTNANTNNSGPLSPVLGRNSPAAAAKKFSNPSTPSTSGEFVIPKANSGPTIPRVNTPPLVAPRTPTDAGPSNPTTIVSPPTTPRKVGERVPSTEVITDQPIKPVAVHGHGTLASSLPTRSAPLHHELRTSTPTTSADKAQISYTPASNPVVVVSSAPPKGPAPAPPKARTDAIENIKATSTESIPPIKQNVEPTEASSGTKDSPRPKSAPVKVPAIQANVQRKTVDDTLSPRSAVISPRTPRSPKSPVLSPRVTERPISPPPIAANAQPVLSNVPAIVIEDEPKPQPSSSFKYSKPLLPLPDEDLDQGVTHYSKNVRPPSPREDDEIDQAQGVTRYTKNVRPPTPREDDEPTGLAPPDSDNWRASVEVDIDPIMMTLSPRTLQQKIREVEENGFYGTGLDYYLGPENQPDFASDVQDGGDGLTNSDETSEARKSAWVKVTKPKSRMPRGDNAKPDLAKVRGTIDPDELSTRPVSVMIANRNINDDEPPEEDSGNEKDGPPGDVPAGPNEGADSESSDDGENKAAKKAIKDLKKIQKFFTKVIPKKLGINKDKEGGESSDSSSSDSEGKPKVAFDDSALTPEEREARKKQLEEEERIRKEEKERRKQEKERLKREQKEREEKEKEERDKIKQAEREEKEKLKREEKEKEEKEKEERDKVKQAEKEKEREEKERLKKEKEEREAKEREEAEKNKPAPGISNFKVDKKAPNIAKVLPKLSEDDANRLNHATVDRPAFKGRRPPTRVLRPGIVTTEGDNEIEGQAAPTPATPMEL